MTVAAESRDSRGKNEARRLRAKGSMPAVLYGGPSGPTPLTVSPKELTRILHSKTGHNTIFNLSLAGAGDTPVMVVDWQYDPVKDSLLHVDLKRIDLSQRMTVMVPVVTQGEPKGVKIQGGIHEIITREVEIECLPNDIPEQFVVDVSELMIGQSIRAGDIQTGELVKLLSQPDMVISHVVSLRVEEEPAAEAVVEAAATPTAGEPEVIKKGKKEEEGGAEPAAPKKK
ncbi:MAG: 50S ribosomal protein L25 [Bryobacteraceae bacterium]